MKFDDILFETHEMMAEFESLDQLQDAVEYYGSDNFTVWYRAGSECPYKLFIPNNFISPSTEDKWNNFKDKIKSLNDPLINSVLSQASTKDFKISADGSVGCLTVYFPQTLDLFDDWLSQTQLHWQPLLNEAFHVPTTLLATFE